MFFLQPLEAVVGGLSAGIRRMVERFAPVLTLLIGFWLFTLVASEETVRDVVMGVGVILVGFLGFRVMLKGMAPSKK